MTPSEQIEVSNLHLGTLFPDTSACIPTVIDNAASQGLIADRLIGISFEPTESIESTNGELTFGDVDTSKFSGELNFVFVTFTMLLLVMTIHCISSTGRSPALRRRVSLLALISLLPMGRRTLRSWPPLLVSPTLVRPSCSSPQVSSIYLTSG